MHIRQTYEKHSPVFVIDIEQTLHNSLKVPRRRATLKYEIMQFFPAGDAAENIYMYVARLGAIVYSISLFRVGEIIFLRCRKCFVDQNKFCKIHFARRVKTSVRSFSTMRPEPLKTSSAKW